MATTKRMAPFLCARDDEDWELLKSLLPRDWRDAARIFGAIRANKGPFSDPELLLRTILGHVAKGNSFRETTGHARETKLADVSDVAFFKRFRNATDWLEFIVTSMLAESLTALPALESPARLRLVDATCVSKPGSTGTDFRLHFTVCLPERKFIDANLTNEKGAESFERFDVKPGDIFVGDRCYGNKKNVLYVRLHEGHPLVRITATSLPLFRDHTTQINLLEEARKLKPGEDVDLDVNVLRDEDEPVEGRLCIHALSNEEAEKSQQRMRKKKGKKQKRPKARAIESAKYVFVFTTLPRKLASVDEVFAIYRLRWQIELAFKSLKSVLKLGKLPNKREETCRAWINAKVICALLVDHFLHSQPGTTDNGTRPSPYRSAAFIFAAFADALLRQLRLVVRIQIIRSPARMPELTNGRRRRQVENFAQRRGRLPERLGFRCHKSSPRPASRRPNSRRKSG